MFLDTSCVYFDGNIQIKGGKAIKIGKKTKIGRGMALTAWKEFNNIIYSPFISIGQNCNFGESNHITSINRITIGDEVLTGRWVTISDNSHGSFDKEQLNLAPITRPLVTKGEIIIGDRVWIGDKATILSGVTIGDGAIIGANAVVTKDVPPYSLVVGSPARVVKILK